MGFCPLLYAPRMDPHVNCSIYSSSIPLEQPTSQYIWRQTSFEGTCNTKLLQSVVAGPTIGGAFSWMDFLSSVLHLRVASCLISFFHWTKKWIILLKYFDILCCPSHKSRGLNCSIIFTSKFFFKILLVTWDSR